SACLGMTRNASAGSNAPPRRLPVSMRCGVVLAAAVLTACAADDGSMGDAEAASAHADAPVDGPDFEVRCRAKRGDGAPGVTQPVCRGTLDEIDRHVETVAGLLDIAVQSRPTWYWFNEHADDAVIGWTRAPRVAPAPQSMAPRCIQVSAPPSMSLCIPWSRLR